MMARSLQSVPLRANTKGVTRYFTPFIRAGILSTVDVHVVAALDGMHPGSHLDALLACALAVRAPRHGHICIDLKTVAQTTVSEAIPRAESEREPPLFWPENDWIHRVAASPLVHTYSPPETAQSTAPFILNGTQIYMNRYWLYQTRLATTLRQRVQIQPRDVDRPLLRASMMHLFRGEPTVENRQALGVAMAALSAFSVISGGPGMGKTFTVRNLLTVLYLQHRAAALPSEHMESKILRVALAAPTGKAAARLRSAISDGLQDHLDRCTALLGDTQSVADFRDFLAELESFTVHRLLGFNPRNRSRFRFGEENPLPFDVVIIDEASMVDFAMMTKLVSAVSEQARLVLLGDKHQLASIDAGSVLRDLCGPVNADQLQMSQSRARELAHLTNTPVGQFSADPQKAGLGDSIIQLNRNYRFTDDSGIGAFASACLRKDMAAASAVFETDSGYSDVQRIGYDAQGRTLASFHRLMVDQFSPFLVRLLEGPQEGESDERFHEDVLRVFDRVRILCTHRNGRLGVDGINELMESLLREALKDLDFTTHHWTYLGRPVMVTQNDHATGLYNGDIGLFVNCQVGKDSQRRIVFPSDDGVRYITPARLPAHDTAFAMTIHKSQGSQFEHAVVILPRMVSPIVTRELIYTGVTRAVRRVTLVGPSEVLRDGLQREVQRASGLRSLVWGG